MVEILEVIAIAHPVYRLLEEIPRRLMVPLRQLQHRDPMLGTHGDRVEPTELVGRELVGAIQTFLRFGIAGVAPEEREPVHRSRSDAPVVLATEHVATALPRSLEVPHRVIVFVEFEIQVTEDVAGPQRPRVGVAQATLSAVPDLFLLLPASSYRPSFA